MTTKIVFSDVEADTMIAALGRHRDALRKLAKSHMLGEAVEAEADLAAKIKAKLLAAYPDVFDRWDYRE